MKQYLLTEHYFRLIYNFQTEIYLTNHYNAMAKSDLAILEDSFIEWLSTIHNRSTTLSMQYSKYFNENIGIF